MRQQIAGKTVRVLGRTAEDGGMLWLMSSLSEAGFTVNGAAEVKLALKADAADVSDIVADVTDLQSDVSDVSDDLMTLTNTVAGKAAS